LIGGEGLTATVALTGSGRLRRALALEPTSVTFSPTPLGGQSGPLTIAARNAGQAPVAIQSVTLGGAGADQFAVVSSECSGATLAPGSACSIGLVAKPTRVGASAATLTVTGQQGESAAATLDVDGQPMAVLTITPAAVAFPSTIVGTSGPAVDLAVANTGGSPVTISAVALQGAGADQFTVAADGCTTIVLAVGASCTVSLAPVPTRAGQQTAVFLVTGDGGQSASATLDVLAGIAPTLRMNPAVVRPGDVTVAVGAGFPPNRDVALSFSRGTNTYKVTTDATGAFRLTIVMLRNGLPIGGMQLIAADQTDFTGVRAPLLVDQASFQPSASRDAAFTNGVTTMFARHG
ncbi:MAG: choice-of-anchor D domain-containing protein, partial [Ilumatobacteraceae bacterium]